MLTFFKGSTCLYSNGSCVGFTSMQYPGEYNNYFSSHKLNDVNTCNGRTANFISFLSVFMCCLFVSQINKKVNK